MQGNGGAVEAGRRSGFERGGWAMGKADDDTRTSIGQTYQRADAFRFDRRTFGPSPLTRRDQTGALRHAAG